MYELKPIRDNRLYKPEWDKMAVGYWYKITDDGILDFV